MSRAASLLSLLDARPVALVGAGRVGRALASALTAVGVPVAGPLGRGAAPAEASLVLLCVPDRAIVDVAAALGPGAIVGHCAASVPLDVLAPHERLGWHPLLSVTGERTTFEGATAAVDGSTERALDVATALAEALGMRPRRVDAAHRALYHAAASMSANYLVTLESAAERLAVAAGVDRAALAPLVRSALDAWERDGAAALTGPVARGDEETVARQRAAVAHALPDLLPLWDTMTDATRTLVTRA